jgi:hypothetical protein
MGGLRLETKTRSLRNAFSLAGRAGFEYHPLNGDPRLKVKQARKLERVFVAGRAGFEYHPLNGGPAAGNKNALLAKRVFSGGEGGIRISSPEWGPCGWKQKRAPCETRFLWRGGRDSNPRLRFKPQHSLSRRAQSATLAPPRVHIYHFTRFIRSGGSGIRTHVGVTQTCFQDMRLRPLGHPSSRGDFTMIRMADSGPMPHWDIPRTASV